MAQLSPSLYELFGALPSGHASTLIASNYLITVNNPIIVFLFHLKHSPKNKITFLIPIHYSAWRKDKSSGFSTSFSNSPRPTSIAPLHQPTTPTHHLRTLGFLTPSVSRTLPIFSFHAPERWIAKVPTTNYVLDQRAPGGSNSAPYICY